MRMSMNLIAITILASIITAAGILSPTPQEYNINERETLYVKEGEKEVVVEAGDGNTKVSISPAEPEPSRGTIEEQLSRAAASVAGVAQDVKGKAEEVLSNSGGPFGAGPRELICDAFGKCKHRMARVLSKAKEKAFEAEEKVKDFASRVTHKAEERTEGVRENAQEKVKEAGETAGRAKEKAGEGVWQIGKIAREATEKVKGRTEEVAENTLDKIKQKGMEGKNKFTHLLKRAKDVVLGTIGYAIWPKSMGSLMGMIQILGSATAYGMSIWVTFIMSRALAGMLPRHQFGMLQSRIYPLYFKTMVASIGLALLGHLALQRSKLFKNKPEMVQALNLLGSLLSALANLRVLDPRATKAMFEKIKMEKEEGRGRDHDDVHASTTKRETDEVESDTRGDSATSNISTRATMADETRARSQEERDEAMCKISKLDKRLKELNSYSSMLNMASLIGLTWHLMYLGQRLALKT